MNKILKRLTYANVMSSIAVFLVLGGAAFAAAQLPKNSVGKKQLKNGAVTTAKLKKNAVTAAKIKDGAVTNTKIQDSAVTTAKLQEGSVTGGKVLDGSLTGADINLGTLGTVPSATNAASAVSANNLVGQTTFFVRLGFGESKTLATNGAVSFVAECIREGGGGDDIARILEQTSVNGAVAGGDDDWEGGADPADFLNVDTKAEERELVENSVKEGEVNVDSEIDQGFVLGPDGKGLSTNSEGIILGLNYGGSGCLFAGVINAVG